MTRQKSGVLNKGTVTISAATTTIIINESNHTYHSSLNQPHDLKTLPLREDPLIPSDVPDENRTRSGVPADLLWLPYIILTLALTSLLVASFLHFHCKNGHKYQRRRAVSTTSGTTGSAPEPDWRQRIVENALESNRTGLESETCKQIKESHSDNNPGFSSKSTVSSSVFQCSTREQKIQERNDCEEVRLKPQQVVNRVPNHSVANLNYCPPGLCSSRSQRGPVAMINHRLARTCDVVYPLQSHRNTARNPAILQDKKKQTDGSGAGGVRTVYEYVTNCNGSMINMKCSADEGVNSSRTNNVSRPKNKNERRKEGSNPARTSIRKPVDSVASKGMMVGWSNEPNVNCFTGQNPNLLYRASKICRMDETDEDWEILLSQSTI